MELHEQVARCFTDAMLEWRQEEKEKIEALPEFEQLFAHMHLEIQDRAIMDIVARAGMKIKKLNEYV